MAHELSLYLDLKEGELADLDVAAKIALAWSTAIKEIGAHVAPDLDLEVKLESGSTGSLSLNGILRSVARQVSDPITLRVIVVTATLFLMKESAAWGVGKVLDWLNTEDAAPITLSLSESDKTDLAERVVKELAAKTGQENIKLIFREAQKDEAIRGVGATTAKGKRPRLIVPRNEFNDRMSDVLTDEKGVETRKPSRRVEVVIIRPVLKNLTNRAWRFQSFTGEFSATVKDADFLERALTGAADIPLREGVVLDVLLEVVEERKHGQEGAWEQKSHSILKVYGYRVPYSQRSLDGLSPPQKE